MNIAAVMPDSEHVMEYHVVTKGSCWARSWGEAPVSTSGDISVSAWRRARYFQRARNARARGCAELLP